MKDIWIQIENKINIIFSILFITYIICKNYIPEVLFILNPLLFISLILIVIKGFNLQTTTKSKYLFVLCIIIVISIFIYKWRILL